MNLTEKIIQYIHGSRFLKYLLRNSDNIYILGNNLDIDKYIDENDKLVKIIIHVRNSYENR